MLKMMMAGLLTGCMSQVDEIPTSETDEVSPVAPTMTEEAPATEVVTEVVSSPTPEPTPTQMEPPASTATLHPTDEPITEPVAELPALGRVVRARHAGVRQSGRLLPDAVREMVDAGMAALAGREDPSAAWSSLFSPDERVAIKVNAIGSSSFWTHVPLVLAVVASLEEIGLAGEQIVIFDRQTHELEYAGFTINRDGPGVRCYGTDGAYTRSWSLLEREIGVSDVLLSCDALINIPLLKAHGTSGMSFALKNHYGTFDRPARYHASIDQALGALNALPPIADRTRLTIGDALDICTRGWHSAVEGDAVLLSLDPVAHDALGAQMLAEAVEAEGGNSTVRQRTASWLAHATQLGLGVAVPEDIDVVEIGMGG
jgi:hypothetical protein